jgi:hypothetical protein
MAGSYRKLAVVGKMNNLYFPALGVMILLCMAGLLWMSKAMAEEWPVVFSWSYPQPVPEHVRFELRVQPCSTCDLEAVETTRMLAVSRSYDYDALQGSHVVVLDIRSGAEIGRLPALQTRLDARLLPALRECRMGGDCPGSTAMREMLREDGERAMPRDRVEPRVIEP